MSHVGSRNHPDGYTARDDSLPHQIRHARNSKTGSGNHVHVTCNCGADLGVWDTADPGWLSKAWDAYDDHTMSKP